MVSPFIPFQRMLRKKSVQLYHDHPRYLNDLPHFWAGSQPSPGAALGLCGSLTQLLLGFHGISSLQDHLASAVTHQSIGLQHIRQTWRIGMPWNHGSRCFQKASPKPPTPVGQAIWRKLSVSFSLGASKWFPELEACLVYGQTNGRILGDVSPHLSPWGGPNYFAGFQLDLIRPQLGSSPHDFARPRPRILHSSSVGSIRINSAVFSSSPRKFISKNAQRQPIPRSISEATLWARLEQVL